MYGQGAAKAWAKSFAEQKQQEAAATARHEAEIRADERAKCAADVCSLCRGLTASYGPATLVDAPTLPEWMHQDSETGRLAPCAAADIHERARRETAPSTEGAKG